jgi:phage terminase large subunit-like protein
MSDEPELGPDPNHVRRHAKKMHTEMQYRRRYCRLDYYRPNPRQKDFHNLVAAERCLRAGNQQGKTHCCAGQMAMDALGRYADWYKGRRFDRPPAIERPTDFVGWAGCTTSTTTRDGLQAKLLGDLTQHDGMGTGLIPLDNIVGRPTMARGISGFVDTVSLRRDSGGTAIIRQKTFEMDRAAWQGEAVDEVWIDEDPGDDVIYGECLARLTSTKGQIICSMTPVLGTTPIRRRFKEKTAGAAEILMTIEDAEHIPAEERATIIARYKESERATRVYGADMQGEGAVFEIPEERIKHSLDPATFPPYWPFLWAIDFSHGGMSAEAHPFAAVLGCHDRDTDTIYVIEAIRMRQALPLMHVDRLKRHPCFDAPVAWPHDGGITGFGSAETYAATYKRLGLNMLGTHATFRDGGFKFENGIAEMEQRFATGRLLIASHLGDVFDEYRGYHRVNNLVHKVDDDLLSAIRILCMQIRSAKVLVAGRPGQPGAYRGWDGSFTRQAEPRIAEHVDFPLFE